MKQGIHEQSATPKYPIGTRLALGDRVFHYCRAVTALRPHHGEGNNDALHEQETAVAASAGDLSLTIVGDFTKDQFKGGYINIHTTPMQVCLRIKGNDAGDGVNTVLHLKDPLLYDVPAGSSGFTDVHANIYNNVGGRSGGTDYTSAICIPLINVTIDYYFWGQTWGPVVATAASLGGLGGNADERAVYFDDDGSIGIMGDCAGGGTSLAQYAGFLLATTSSGKDDIFFMLQLAP